MSFGAKGSVLSFWEKQQFVQISFFIVAYLQNIDKIIMTLVISDYLE